MTFDVPLNRRSLIAAFVVLAVCVLVFYFGQRVPRYVDAERVWKVVQRESAKQELDPRFVFAIVMAESSLNARADSGQARGMMQMTPGTWGETTDEPYGKAWDWPSAIRVGTQHLGDLRARLEAETSFSYPRLAAAYRYGYYGLKAKEFDVAAMPVPRNRIYRELFEGRIPEPGEVAP